MNRTKKYKSVKLHVVGSRLPAIVSIEAADLYKLNEKSWSLSTSGHVVTNAPRSTRNESVARYQLSRVVLGLYDGNYEDLFPMNPVRHINNDRLDCRNENLVACSWQQIAATQKTIRKNNTTGYRGVYFNKRMKKYHATIRPNNKVINLGYFEDPKKAAKAYDLAAIKYFGDNASINGVISIDDMD